MATPNLCSEGHKRYGRDWRGLEPPRHLVVFTPTSLDRALELAGFETRTRLPGSLEAEREFAQSEAIRAQVPNRRRLRVAAAAANLRSWRNPERAEELVVLARP